VRTQVLTLLLLFIGAIIACNNFDFGGIRDRFKDNMNGTLFNPGNIDPAGTDAFSFAVMGDSHTGVSWGRVLPSAAQHSQAAGDAFVVLAGDVTNFGKEEEFAEFMKVFSDLGMAFRAVIGNHDLYFDGWKSYSKFLGRSIYSFDADNVHFSMIDTGNGVLGEPQLNWLKSDLENTTQPIKIVVSHYPAISADFDTLNKMASEEEAAILKNMLNKYQVNIMFAGHYHGYRAKQLGFTNYIVTGGINTVLDPGNDKHYVRVTVNGNMVSVHKIDL